ncbi:hypothetical protein Bbelb_045560 [Branchiostoma belcheri]|nr:hypothetical protein Bbelb_045560 [Branchiostoma belcheri]
MFFSRGTSPPFLQTSRTILAGIPFKNSRNDSWPCTQFRPCLSGSTKPWDILHNRSSPRHRQASYCHTDTLKVAQATLTITNNRNWGEGGGWVSFQVTKIPYS